MTFNPGSGRVRATLAAPVKLFMLLTLEAKRILLPSWSCVQAGTPTQPQIPVETPPSPAHKGNWGPPFPQNEMN